MGALNRDTTRVEQGLRGDQGTYDPEIFSRYPPMQFTVAGLTLAFFALRIQQNGGNRVIERKRPYRKGAKLDSTGSEAIRWTVDVIFNNTIPQLPDINAGLPMYPDVLNLLLANFDIQETGDLVVTTTGTTRVKAESYSRIEKFDERDQAVVQFVFCEDNEDGVDFRSISAPTAGANGARLANTTTFDTQSFGSISDALLDLEVALIELEALANTPGDVAQDIEAIGLRVEGAARTAERVHSEAGRPGRDLFLDPANSRGYRKLTRAIELAARERNRARRNQPKLVTIVFRESTSIWRVSAIIGQDPVELLEINPGLDPNFIPAQTNIKVFATESLLNGSSSAA